MTTNSDVFEQFLIRLEPTLSTTADRYRWLRAVLIKFFQLRGCGDADGLADETIGRLLNKLLAGEQIERPSSYVYGIALNVYKEHVRWEARFTQLLEVQEVPGDYPDPFTECAIQCLEKLAEDRRVLLEQYYSKEVPRSDIARRIGTSLAGLRTRIHRIRLDVKECYERCIMKSS